ncbi:unnamed protein product [Blepharisma stoltei]|uniref:Uncharacterized protein n=1 Tax=Blepharisma stoltei TaxID=1481888 RepID=A0AAU9JQ52_9CILI|nr:unnamed protein product [Blepharisma stoltei]
MNSNKFPSLGYSNRLRSQTPYTQATYTEILEDLEMLNWHKPASSQNEIHFPPKILKKRKRTVNKIENLDEDLAIESLISLMMTKKPALKKFSVKKIVKKCVSFEILQENVDPVRKVQVVSESKIMQKMTNQWVSPYFVNFSFPKSAFVLPTAKEWKSLGFPYQDSEAKIRKLPLEDGKILQNKVSFYQNVGERLDLISQKIT